MDQPVIWLLVLAALFILLLVGLVVLKAVFKLTRSCLVIILLVGLVLLAVAAFLVLRSQGPDLPLPI